MLYGNTTTMNMFELYIFAWLSDSAIIRSVCHVNVSGIVMRRLMHEMEMSCVFLMAQMRCVETRPSFVWY